MAIIENTTLSIIDPSKHNDGKVLKAAGMKTFIITPTIVPKEEAAAFYDDNTATDARQQDPQLPPQQWQPQPQPQPQQSPQQCLVVDQDAMVTTTKDGIVIPAGKNNQKQHFAVENPFVSRRYPGSTQQPHTPPPVYYPITTSMNVDPYSDLLRGRRNNAATTNTGKPSSNSSDNEGEGKEKVEEAVKTKIIARPRKRWKKPIGKPCRPLPAYNVFFKKERASNNHGLFSHSSPGTDSLGQRMNSFSQQWPHMNDLDHEDNVAAFLNEYAPEVLDSGLSPNIFQLHRVHQAPVAPPLPVTGMSGITAASMAATGLLESTVERKRVREKHHHEAVNEQFQALTNTVAHLEAQEGQRRGVVEPHEQEAAGTTTAVSVEERRVRSLSTTTATAMENMDINRIELLGRTILHLDRLSHATKKQKRIITALEEKIGVSGMMGMGGGGFGGRGMQYPPTIAPPPVEKPQELALTVPVESITTNEVIHAESSVMERNKAQIEKETGSTRKKCSNSVSEEEHASVQQECKRLKTENTKLLNEKTLTEENTGLTIEKKEEEMRLTYELNIKSYESNAAVENLNEKKEENISLKEEKYSLIQDLHRAKEELKNLDRVQQQRANGQGRHEYNNSQQKRLLLAMAADQDNLSDRQCYVRSEMVEIIAATEKDVSARNSKGNQKLVTGQVGFRCVHCAHLRPRDRAERAVCYPPSIMRIYQSIADMQRFHFEKCREIPMKNRKIYKSLKTTRPRGVGSPQTYWVQSAKLLDLVDTENGIQNGGEYGGSVGKSSSMIPNIDSLQHAAMGAAATSGGFNPETCGGALFPPTLGKFKPPAAAAAGTYGIGGTTGAYDVGGERMNRHLAGGVFEEQFLQCASVSRAEAMMQQDQETNAHLQHQQQSRSQSHDAVYHASPYYHSSYYPQLDFSPPNLIGISPPVKEISSVGQLAHINDGKDSERSHDSRAIFERRASIGWTPEEDAKVTELVKIHGDKKWTFIARQVNGRSGKQCRERWCHHLNPDINKGEWSSEEDKALIQAHDEIGNRWVEISERLMGRTDNAIKNRWNSAALKRIMNKEVSPSLPASLSRNRKRKSASAAAAAGPTAAKGLNPTSAADGGASPPLSGGPTDPYQHQHLEAYGYSTSVSSLSSKVSASAAAATSKGSTKQDRQKPQLPPMTVEERHKQEAHLQSMAGYLVNPSDVDMIPPYVYSLMQQVEPCLFTEADRFVARSKGPVGYPGFQCRHCNGHAGLGKYFPVSSKSFSTNSTSQNIHAHMLKCRKCPEMVKEQLIQLKIEKSRAARLEPGWRKVFFDKVWHRLHYCEGSSTKSGSSTAPCV